MAARRGAVSPHTVFTIVSCAFVDEPRDKAKSRRKILVVDMTHPGNLSTIGKCCHPIMAGRESRDRV
jgi:hypothetical protein